MIPEVIELYKENKIQEAGKLLFDNNPLSLICSIVCPHEDFCRGNCILEIKGKSVNFPLIEKEISGEYFKKLKCTSEISLDKRVAIIGSGPSGIVLAIILAKNGYQVTIFERHSKIGRVLKVWNP